MRACVVCTQTLPPLFVLPPTPPPPNRACSLEKRCVYSMGKQYSKEEEAATAENRPRLGPPAGSKEKILGGQQKCIFLCRTLSCSKVPSKEIPLEEKSHSSFREFQKSQRAEKWEISLGRKWVGEFEEERERKCSQRDAYFGNAVPAFCGQGRTKRGGGRKRVRPSFKI